MESRRDRVRQMYEPFIARASTVLNISKDLAKKHIGIALDNIDAELDLKEMKSIGIVNTKDVQVASEVFEQILKDHFDDWIEWYLEKALNQIQAIAVNEIRRSAQIACEVCLQKDNVKIDDLKEILSKKLSKNKT